MVIGILAIGRSGFQDWELWLVDDGSTDGSGQVAQALGAGGPLPP